jgi:hypothetical protein
LRRGSALRIHSTGSSADLGADTTKIVEGLDDFELVLGKWSDIVVIGVAVHSIATRCVHSAARIREGDARPTSSFGLRELTFRNAHISR